MNRSRTRSRVVLAGLVAALAIGMIAGPVLAAKGGGKGGGKPSAGTGTISGPVLVQSADNVVSYHDLIRFTVSTTSTTEPWVRLECYQGGTLVAVGSEGYFERALDDGTFGLYSPSWTGGAADCTAKLTTSSGAELARTSFYVSG
jgi:hypothetical protein